MKVKINYHRKNFPSWFIVEGETIEEIKRKIRYECALRGLTEYENNLYSEKIKD